MAVLATMDITDPRFQAVFATVDDVLCQVIGADYYEEIVVSPDSGLTTDLELESVEILELAERLIALYGDRVDFIGWFAAMELEELVHLTIGQLVTFVVVARDAPGPRPSATES